MIADVREHLDRVPFVPFVVRTSDGHEYSVPTVDHVFITPSGNRVIVIADDGAVAILGPVHINALVEQPNGA
jgi:outer membrane lipoprotein SlyB